MFKKIVFSSSILFFCYFLSTAQTYTINTGGNVKTCTGTLYDDGGAFGNYTKGVTQTMTFCSSDTNTCISFDFNSFNILAADSFTLYDGPSTSSPLLTKITNGNYFSESPVISTKGCITVKFVSASTGAASAGWDLTISCLYCPIVVTPSPSVLNIQNLLFGPDVKVSNLVINCPNDAYGSFTATSSNIGVTNGLLLTSGKASFAPGPNDIDNKGENNLAAGDTCLEKYLSGNGTGCVIGGACSQAGCVGTSTINGVCTCTTCSSSSGQKSFDACSIEFDIIPTCDSIKINYVFASEEYPEFVNASYNDAFAFFISGPGINGTGCNNSLNIATIPVVGIPVSIDNLNDVTNSQYYIDNSFGAGGGVQYDAFTKVLTAKSKVKPCSSYHIKMVIADFGDGVYDSGVFLQKGGINCGTPSLKVTAIDPVECCTNGMFTITLDQPSTDSVTIKYTIGGTATKGTDYTSFPDSIIVPKGQTTVTIPVAALCDGINEGTETVVLNVGQNACVGILTGTATMTIWDPLKANAGPDLAKCAGKGVTLTATGGNTYSWSPGTDLSCMNCANPVATPLDTASYVVTATVNGCTAKDTVKVIPNPITILSTTSTPATCNNLDGSASVNATGGIPGYSYTWSSGATTITANNLIKGTYTVTSTDAKGCTATTTAVVANNTPAGTITITPSSVSCKSGTNGSAVATITGGTNPFTYSWSLGGATGQTINNLAVGVYTVTIRDANNCIVTSITTITEPSILSVTATTSSGGCTTAFGSATASSTGGTSGYSYSWTPGGQTSATISNLAAGTYSVTSTDAKGCTSSTTAVVSTTTPNTVTVVSTDAKCNGSADGTATASVSGGTPGYSYSWTNGSTGQTVTNLSFGVYKITVTDAAGCTSTTSGNINQPTAIVPSVSSTPANCGQINGTVSVSVTGGTPAYSFAWSMTGVTTTTISNLAAGNYTLTTTDSKGCTTVTPIVVNGTPNVVVAVVPTNVTCKGGSNGKVVVSASGGSGVYTYSWSNGASGASTISGLIPGIYKVTVSDGNGCSSSTSVIIGVKSTLSAGFNPDPTTGTQPLTVNFNNTSTGGATSFTWLFGDTTQSVLINPTHVYPNIGTYTAILVARDSLGCIDTAKYDISIKEKCLAFIIPNVFSPNNDGQNDIYRITGKCIVTFDAIIYDRWGLKMYNWNTINGGWDGNSNGKQAPSGTYYYLVKATAADGTQYDQAGFLQLIR